MGISKSILDTDILETCEEAKQKIAQGLTAIFKEGFKPPPRMNMVEFAEKYRVMPDNVAKPGPFRVERAPAAREPMLAITDPNVQEVTVMCCVQMMKTELMLNACFYYMYLEPSPMMYVAPKKELAEAWSKERFTKSLNAMPELRHLISSNRRDQGNTILQKQFPGGQLSIVSARNEDDLAMRACRIMLFDECDKYPSNVGAKKGGEGGEGDPIEVAWGRATTFGRSAKKITACSPTVENRSRIEKEYLAGSQGVFSQPCPSCGHLKELEWDDVVIPVNKETGEYLPDEAYIACSECGHKWTEQERLKSIDDGVYVHKRPERIRHRSYKASSFGSKFIDVPSLARQFVKVMGDINGLKTFYNTRMARTWKEKGEQPDWQTLYDRREQYKIGVVPKGGLILSMGIDVQKNGIYWELVALGRRRITWSVDHGYEAGDIEEDSFREWIKSNLFDRRWRNEAGIEMEVSMINVDSGYKSNAVYSLVREYSQPNRVRAIKGDQDGRLMRNVGTPTPVDVDFNGKRFSRGLMLWPVGSGVLKDQFYNWLQLTKPTDEKLKAGGKWPSGFCHFPEYEEEYFKQITAEEKFTKVNSKGFEVSEWRKVRKDNHLLDCRNYASAGFSMLQVERLKDSDWDNLENKLTGKKIEKENNKKDTVKINGKVRRKTNWL